MGKEYSLHKICLSAIFLFGNIALFVPYKNAKNGDLSAIILALTAGVLLYYLWYFLAKKIHSASSEKPLAKAIIYIMVLLCVIANAITSRNFVKYMSDEVLIKNPKFIILMGFVAISIYFISKTNETLAKFSLISFAFIVVVMICLFAVSAENFNDISLEELFFGKVIKRSGVYLYKALLFPFIFALFSCFAFTPKTPKRDIIGQIIGSAMILLCYLSAVFTFGLKFSSNLDFAYPISISVVNIGELYTRMDGFAYFIFFLSALIKSVVCGQTIKMLLLKTNAKKPFAKTVFLMALSFAVSYLL
ncbi:MAG: GerAB/ArcD/ProY family transporter [Clostridia bacterium]|nr:GerAB/ArcD/ProY family transporter [Clostridia bacterium]